MIRTPDAKDRVIKHIGPSDEFNEEDFKIACTKKGLNNIRVF